MVGVAGVADDGEEGIGDRRERLAPWGTSATRTRRTRPAARGGVTPAPGLESGRPSSAAGGHSQDRPSESEPLRRLPNRSTPRVTTQGTGAILNTANQ